MASNKSEEHCPCPETIWPKVDAARAGDFEALSNLSCRYRRVLKSHLVFNRGVEPDRADDLVQDFFMKKFRGVINKADPRDGKFRSLLLKSLENHKKDVEREEGAAKRRPPGGFTEIGEHEDDVRVGPAGEFLLDRDWAYAVFKEALRLTQADLEAAGHASWWGVYEARRVSPLTNGDEPVEFHILVERFHFKDRGQADQALLRATQRFGWAVRWIVREYARDDSEIDRLVEDLIRILSRPVT